MAPEPITSNSNYAGRSEELENDILYAHGYLV